jgi:hypothetical protein
VIFNGARVFYHAEWLWSNPRFLLLAGKKTRPPFLIDKTGAPPVGPWILTTFEISSWTLDIHFHPIIQVIQSYNLEVISKLRF